MSAEATHAPTAARLLVGFASPALAAPVAAGRGANHKALDWNFRQGSTEGIVPVENLGNAGNRFERLTPMRQPVYSDDLGVS